MKIVLEIICDEFVIQMDNTLVKFYISEVEKVGSLGTEKTSEDLRKFKINFLVKENFLKQDFFKEYESIFKKFLNNNHISVGSYVRDDEELKHSKTYDLDDYQVHKIIEEAYRRGQIDMMRGNHHIKLNEANKWVLGFDLYSYKWVEPKVEINLQKALNEIKDVLAAVDAEIDLIKKNKGDS